jgi:hypothetical protein
LYFSSVAQVWELGSGRHLGFDLVSVGRVELEWELESKLVDEMPELQNCRIAEWREKLLDCWMEIAGLLD